MKRRSLLSALIGLSLLTLLGACGSSTSKSGVPEGPAPASPPLTLQSQILGVTVAGRPVVTFTLFDPNGVPLIPTGSTPTSADQARVRFTIARIEADGNYKNYIKSSTPTQPTFDSGGTFAAVGNGTYTYTFKTDIDNAVQTLDNIVVTGNRDKTHTVGAQMERTVTDNANLVPVLRSFVQAANPYLNFRPDGGAVTATREVVSVSSCNECHGLLGLHGGGRRDVALCILCHNPGVVDPDTQNSVDMKSLIHKIHMGKKLPSHDNTSFGRTDNVVGDYTIIGFSGSVHSYKTVGYPFFSTDNTINQTPADCVKCHKLGTDLTGKAFGRDADKYKTNPTINKCTTCHDLAAFNNEATIGIRDNTTLVQINAVPHSGGPFAVGADDPSLCSICHEPGVAGVDEFNESVVGAHTIVEKSSRNPGVNFAILAVDNATAGKSPVVRFKVTLDNGTVVVPNATSNVTSFNLRMGYTPAGSIDFANNLLFDNVTRTGPGQPTSFALAGSATAVNRLVNNGDGSFTGALVLDNDVLPLIATGIGVVSIEGRFGLIGSFTTGHKGTRTNSSIRFSGEAAQWFFDLGTGVRITDPLQTRRVRVVTSKCNVCHTNLRLHGGSRINVEECVICHNPNATDRGQRPKNADGTVNVAATVDGLSDRPIDFKVMIHKIHSGENLNQKPYIIYGNGGSINDFAEVRYPRDRRDCLACHADETPPVFGLPLRAGIQGTSVATGAIQNDSADDTKIGPTRAVCTACHDDLDFTLPHVLSQTVSPTVELCATCHTTGLTFGPDRVHRPGRPGPFPTE